MSTWFLKGGLVCEYAVPFVLTVFQLYIEVLSR